MALRNLLRGTLGQRLFSSSQTTKSVCQVTTLPSGLRVASVQAPFKTATVGLFIDAGSRFETEKNNGTAHFLEHLAFKGTKKRTKHGLEVEVENMGAMLNAFTSREQTVYYMKSFAKDREKAVEFLSDILLNSVMEPAMVEAERDVILLEMRHVNDQPEELVFDNLHSVAYEGSALGYTILGPEENVKSIQREDLRRYISTHYTAPRMVMAASGGIEHEDLVKLASRYFSGLPSGQADVKLPRCAFHPGELRTRNDTLPLVHFALAVEGVSWSHPDYFPLMVACTIVGQFDRGMGAGHSLSSRLARAAITEGLAHRYASFHTSYSDTGLWGMFGSCEPETVATFVAHVQREWRRLAGEISQEDVLRARSQLRASLMFEIDGTTPSCLEIGRQMLTHGRHLSPKELVERLKAVDRNAVVEVAKKYIVNKSPAVTCIGCSENFPSYDEICAGMVR